MAWNCKKAFQQQPVIPVRIGIHVGDIVFYEKDIIGDAVNIASRIESVAIVGAVFFSGHVNDQLRSHRQFKTQYLDVFQFKNVKEAIPVFSLIDDQIVVPDPSDFSGSVKWNGVPADLQQNDSGVKSRKRRKSILSGLIVLAALAIASGFYIYRGVGTQKQTPSDTANAIAILPVQNLSGMPQNDVFCEALTNEMLQQLSNKPELGEIVPKSLITDYLKQNKPLTDLANVLGARYILESALHFSDSLYSLDVRLVDPLEQKYLWSDRYEHLSKTNYGKAIETGVVESISLQIDIDARRLRPSASEVITDNKAAYDLLVKANALTDKMDKESFYQALPLYEKAIQLDPELVEAYLGLGRIYLMGGLIWGIFTQDEATSKSEA